MCSWFLDSSCSLPCPIASSDKSWGGLYFHTFRPVCAWGWCFAHTTGYCIFSVAYFITRGMWWSQIVFLIYPLWSTFLGLAFEELSWNSSDLCFDIDFLGFKHLDLKIYPFYIPAELCKLCLMLLLPDQTPELVSGSAFPSVKPHFWADWWYLLSFWGYSQLISMIFPVARVWKYLNDSLPTLSIFFLRLANSLANECDTIWYSRSAVGYRTFWSLVFCCSEWQTDALLSSFNEASGICSSGLRAPPVRILISAYCWKDLRSASLLF